MNLGAVITSLRTELEKIDRAIANLEQLSRPPDSARKSRRGRKSMGPEERKEVSARMKRYWAGRRKKQA